MVTRTASALWEGQGRRGHGSITTSSRALRAHPYAFNSRFAEDRSGTSPEELLAAAHAACVSMALSNACDKAGFATDRLETTAQVHLQAEEEGFVICKIVLRVEACIPEIEDDLFQAIAQSVKRDCPLSRALTSVPEISLTATLV
ncbi:OsmC family peroxiredoxin [Rhodoferax sp.]|uniref:OsmC family peroxiredoxin n=1 Tax=Rhodoferax sp. TaxID=50421 RepID=UPI00374CE574